MGVSFIILIIVIVIIAIWFFLEVKRAKHKALAVFLVVLILFGYLSISYVFKDKVVDCKSVSGVMQAGQIYFSWLGYAFGNLQTATSNAIKMNWEGNATAELKPKK
jgi:hypothetical protein